MEGHFELLCHSLLKADVTKRLKSHMVCNISEYDKEIRVPQSHTADQPTAS